MCSQIITEIILWRLLFGFHCLGFVFFFSELQSFRLCLNLFMYHSHDFSPFFWNILVFLFVFGRVDRHRLGMIQILKREIKEFMTSFVFAAFHFESCDIFFCFDVMLILEINFVLHMLQLIQGILIRNGCTCQ